MAFGLPKYHWKILTMLPLTTDAPIYHYPISTVGMIILNTVCFLAFGPADASTIWMLHYGSLNPIEWITSIFMHVDIFHLIGNMIFLWSFGLIVEGKLGWYRFLIAYLAIGASQCAVEQVLMLHRSKDYALQQVLDEFDLADRDEFIEAVEREGGTAEALAERLQGGSCGASAVIYGLLAMCLVWAPKNEFGVFMLLFFRPLFFDISILWFSIWFIGWEALMFFAGGLSIGSAALHLMGAIVGFGLGVLLLKKDWVDCEGWDLFKVMSGKYGRDLDPTVAVGSHADPTLLFGTDVSVDNNSARPKSKKKKARESRTSLKQDVERLIDSNAFVEAAEAMYALQMQDSNAQLNQSRLKRLCGGLVAAEMADDAEVYLDEYIERFPEDDAWARVRSAQVLVTIKRPKAALMTLKQVRLSRLSPEYQTLARKTVRSAKQLMADGVEDAEPEW